MIAAIPFSVRRIDHVVLRVGDLESMIAFYSNVLGCRLERGPGDARLAQLRAGESLIDLVDAAGPLGGEERNAPDPGARNVDHVCLLVEPWDADALVAHLAAHGIRAGQVETRFGATGNGPSLYFDDPEGNTIELKGGAASRGT